MTALAPVNPLASVSTKGRSPASVDDADAGRFGEMYTRELNKPDEVARPQERPRNEDSKQAQTDSSGVEAETPANQEQAASASAVDPLLASLQQALQPQPVQTALPVQTKTAKADDGGREKNPLLASLLPGAAQPQAVVAGTAAELPEVTTQSVGKNLPVLAEVSANSASGQTDPGDLLPAKGTKDSAFEETLQAAMLPKVSDSRPHELSSSGQRVQSSEAVAKHAVAEPVGDSRWGEAVAQRVSLMLGRQEQKLEMQLNPPNLGPMEVRLSLGGEQASVVFTSQHAGVREALAAATPRLTALLADQGIVLTNVQVASDSLNQQQFQQAYQQQDAQKQQGGSSTGFGEGRDEVQVRELGSIRVPVARSGVSLYV